MQAKRLNLGPIGSDTSFQTLYGVSPMLRHRVRAPMAWVLAPWLPPAKMCVVPYYVGVGGLHHGARTPVDGRNCRRQLAGDPISHVSV